MAKKSALPCSRCVFITQGFRCPDCKKISAPNYSLEAVRTAERLYGTAYGQGRYNEGLGARTFGKSDFNRQVAAKGLRQREPGEKLGPSPRERAAALDKAKINRITTEAIRHL